MTIFKNCLFLKMSLWKKLNKSQNNCNVACNFLCFSFIKKQPKFWPTGNIDLPGSPYSLHGYSGRLGARLTSVEKANWTCSRHSMLFLIAARIRDLFRAPPPPLPYKGSIFPQLWRSWLHCKWALKKSAGK
jgi:hypothetical protein